MLFKSIEELKEQIGYIYASNSFVNISPDLNLASADLRRLIGATVYDLIDYYYHNGKATSDKTMPFIVFIEELLSKARLPEALQAYLAFAPNNDLTHSNSGRQIKVSESEKPAFPWQIERDEAATRSRAFRSTDELIRFMEENTTIPVVWEENKPFKKDQVLWDGSNKTFYLAAYDFTSSSGLVSDVAGGRLVLIHRYYHPVPDFSPETASYTQGDVVKYQENYYLCISTHANESGTYPPNGAYWQRIILNPRIFCDWAISPEFAKMNRLFVSNADDFDAIFPINGDRRLFLHLVPFIADVERRHIVPVLTPEKALDLRTKKINRTLDEEESDLIYQISIPEVLFTMSLACKRLGAHVMPEGILQLYASGLSQKQNAPNDYRIQLATSLERDAREALNKLQEALKKKADGENYTPVNPTDRMTEDKQYFRA